MKKLISLITSLVLILTLSLVPTEQVRAGVFETCVFEGFGEELIFEDLIEEAELQLPGQFHSQLKFRIKFEIARTKYQDFVKCIFNNAVGNILGSAGGSSEGFFGSAAANAANIDAALSLWMQPDVACITQDQLVDVMKDSAPENLLEPLLEIYNQYVVYINDLLAELAASPSITPQNSGDFASVLDKDAAFELLVENEMQDSLVALDTAFIQLKELRIAFMMHVHFQCILQNLEQYRRTMANLRRVLTVIPPLIEDASLTK